jgi:hypothetical protein
VVYLRTLDPTDEAARGLAEQLAHQDRVLLFVLVGFGVLLAVSLAAWQIVTTHRVAGPLFYVSKQMDRIREGQLGASLHPLRKGDLLQDFFEGFREMHEALRGRAMRDAAALERLASRLDGAGQAEVAGELRAMAAEQRRAIE